MNQRKFSLNESEQIFLLYSIQQINALIVFHGKKDNILGLVLNKFISNIDLTTWIFTHKSIVKTLHKNFLMMIRVRKEVNSSNTAASRISEYVTGIGDLMDDLILERTEEEIEKKKEKVEFNERENFLA